MEAMFRMICDHHGLTRVSVSFDYSTFPNRCAVYAHWKAGVLDHCSVGFGNTFDAALSAAISDMHRINGIYRNALPTAEFLEAI